MGLENGLQAMTCNGTTLGTGAATSFRTQLISYPFQPIMTKLERSFSKTLAFLRRLHSLSGDMSRSDKN